AADAKPVVQKVEEFQVFLQHDHPAFMKDAGKLELAQQVVRDWLLEQPPVATARTRQELLSGGEGKLNQQLQRAFYPQRSGDVPFVKAPYRLPGAKGTTHGSPWHYDTHVPLLLPGCGIKPGEFSQPISPAALASTVAELLHIDYPSANSEQ